MAYKKPIDVHWKDFAKTKKLFEKQAESKWNGHLDDEGRMYEAFMHGYSLGVRDAVKARERNNDEP